MPPRKSADAAANPKPPASDTSATLNSARSQLVMESDALVDAYRWC
jgi:hypothetical protein